MIIDRKTMEIIRELEAQLQAFHGFRQLWAELVANREECGLTVEKLESSQSQRLTAVLGQAHVLAQIHGIKWVGTDRLRDFAQELADEPCSYGDNCPSHGTRHGKCLSCKAKEALKI